MGERILNTPTAGLSTQKVTLHYTKIHACDTGVAFCDIGVAFCDTGVVLPSSFFMPVLCLVEYCLIYFGQRSQEVFSVVLFDPS